jgi:hypothetical protein
MGSSRLKPVCALVTVTLVLPAAVPSGTEPYRPPVMDWAWAPCIKAPHDIRLSTSKDRQTTVAGTPGDFLICTLPFCFEYLSFPQIIRDQM